MTPNQLNEAVCLDGGILREVYKAEGWGQVSLRTMLPHRDKPKHRHLHRAEKWVLVRGRDVWLEWASPDGQKSGRRRLGLWKPITIPPGTWHALDNRGDEEAVIVFWMDAIYDRDNPDKEMEAT